MTYKSRPLIVFAGAFLFLMFLTGVSAGLTSPFEGEVIRAVERMRVNGGGEKNTDSGILGGITPHHGIALDMIVRFYERIASEKTLRVWLLSPDHFNRAKNYAVVCGDDWQTAGGILAADDAAKSGLSGMRVAGMNSRLFAEEHGITIHIPLIARYFPNATVVPMVLKTNIPDVPLLMLKNYMLGAMRESDMIILSMDLSHYKTPEGMAAEDERTLEVLTKLEQMRTGVIDIDAKRAASLVLRLFKELGAERGILMEHMDTSDILGYRVESGTSYATILYKAGNDR